MNLKARFCGVALLSSFLVPSAVLAQTYDMAVIKGTDGCGGRPEYSVYIDNEDSNNANNRSGWLGGIVSNTNTTLRFCAVNSWEFSSVAGGPYMLLSLQPGFCGRGAMVQRIVDCENSRPACNSNIPGVILDSGSKDLALTFCYFAQDSFSFNGFPYYGISYGVFAPSSFSGALGTGYVYMDDQQAGITGDNQNYWCDDISGIYDGSACSGLSDDRNYFNILMGGHNTGFRLIRAR